MKSLKLQIRKNLSIFLFLAVVFILSGCAESLDLNTCLPEKIYGFWWGLLHGFISLFTFIISLFKEEVAIYAVNNNGGWYWCKILAKKQKEKSEAAPENFWRKHNDSGNFFSHQWYGSKRKYFNRNK